MQGQSDARARRYTPRATTRDKSRVLCDPAHPMTGPRVYTVDEAQALVPQLEQHFGRLDALREQLRQTKIKLTAIEMIWGNRINDDALPTTPRACTS